MVPVKFEVTCVTINKRPIVSLSLFVWYLTGLLVPSVRNARGDITEFSPLGLTVLHSCFLFEPKGGRPNKTGLSAPNICTSKGVQETSRQTLKTKLTERAV